MFCTVRSSIIKKNTGKRKAKNIYQPNIPMQGRFG